MCCKRTEERPTVLIGKDTRISGYMLESALESGFNSAGVDVVLLGPIPTPAVAYLTRAQRASLGVVISASHNPFPDNGIKFFSAQGTKLPDDWEAAVEAALEEDPVWVDSASLGKDAAHGRRGRPLHRVLQEHLFACVHAQGPEDRGRRRAWCGVSHRTRCVPRTGGRSGAHRLRARWPEHQPGRGRHPSQKRWWPR